MSLIRKTVRSWLAGAVAVLALGAVLPAVAPSTAHAGPGMLSAVVSADCTQGRLQLALSNKSGSEKTFTVRGPDGSLSYTRVVPNRETRLLYWTRPDGAPYTLTTTTDSGFSRTASGTMGCGLGADQPQMNKTALFTTDTVFHGLNRRNADGSHSETNATVESVRIPAMAVTNNGTVIAVTDARVEGTADLPADIQVGMRRSTDNGATWTEAEIIRHAPTTGEGTGDASVVVDRATGDVYCFYTYAPPGISFWSPGSGKNTADDPKSLHVRYIKSTDDGATWGDPVELNPDVKKPEWQQMFISSGHGIQASDGRLVQPIAYRDAAGVSHAANIYSTDNGATWQDGGSAAANVNESKAIERSDGSLVQNMRHNTENRRYYATSTDGAESFGPASATGITDARCNADELSYLEPGDRGANGAPSRTATALYSGNPGTSRTNLTVWLSGNDGESWGPQGGALIQPGTAGYSTMAVLEDGSVGNLYEVGGTGGIYFSRFTLDWVRGA